MTRGSGNNLPLWRRLRRRVYWLLLAGLMKAAAVMPLAAGRRLTEGLALLALEIRSRERRQGLANLALAFPELPAAGRAALLRSSARALGRNLFDTLAAPRVLACGVVREGPPPPGQDPGFSAALARLAAKGRGVLLLTGHIGCWELLGAWTAQLVRREHLGQLAVVTGTIHNEAVDRLVQGRRRDLGMKVLPREQGVRPLLEHLRQQGVLAVLQDQNTRTRNLPAPFFGHPAPTPVGLALLALKYGIPVLPFALARSGRGHEVRWLPPLEPEPAAGPVKDADLRVFLARCNGKLEELIRRNPAEWVWFHERWDITAAVDSRQPRHE